MCNNDQISGIVVHGNKLKLVIFADDMASFVHDKQSHLDLFNTIKLFNTYSGLCVNHDKTEILLLGNMEIKSSELGVKEVSNVVKILGVHFTNNHSLFYKMNFKTIEKSLRESLKGWNLERSYVARENTSYQVICYTKIFVPGFSYLSQERLIMY